MKVKNKDIWASTMKKKINHAWLQLGTNLGNREHHLAQSREWIESSCGKILRSSSIYETSPWGVKEQPAFLNQVVEIETDWSARELLDLLLSIETKMGRIRKDKYGPRLIDIDILLYNNETLKTPVLVVPHPELQNRRFVLIPLAEIAPHQMHPVIKKTISTLVKECKDNGLVTKFAPRS